MWSGSRQHVQRRPAMEKNASESTSCQSSIPTVHWESILGNPRTHTSASVCVFWIISFGMLAAGCWLECNELGYKHYKELRREKEVDRRVEELPFFSK